MLEEVLLIFWPEIPTTVSDDVVSEYNGTHHKCKLKLEISWINYTYKFLSPNRFVVFVWKLQMRMPSAFLWCSTLTPSHHHHLSPLILHTKAAGGTQAHTFMHASTLGSPINLTCVSVGCGRKSEYVERPGRGHSGGKKLHTETQNCTAGLHYTR